MTLTHVGPDGRPRMVDVSPKAVTERTATAEASVRMSQAAFEAIRDGGISKGDVLRVAEVAGTMSAKKTSDLVPLCHQIPLDQVTVDATLDPGLPGVLIRSAAKCIGRTGVEMEALVAASVAAITVYDMVKSVDRTMEIQAVRLLEKTGGARGDWRRPDPEQIEE